jgi:antitoxin component HigA of HigAB toxin-antitoxin module
VSEPPEFPELPPELGKAMENISRITESPQFKQTVKNMRRIMDSIPKQEWADIGRGMELFKQLPPEEQKRYADWTPQQLIVLKQLIDEYEERPDKMT